MTSAATSPPELSVLNEPPTTSTTVPRATGTIPSILESLVTIIARRESAAATNLDLARVWMLLHDLMLLLVAILRPSGVSAGYLLLFLVSHQRARDNDIRVASCLLHGASAVVGATGLGLGLADRVMLDPKPSAWAADLIVCLESCAVYAVTWHAWQAGRAAKEASSRPRPTPFAHSASMPVLLLLLILLALLRPCALALLVLVPALLALQAWAVHATTLLAVLRSFTPLIQPSAAVWLLGLYVHQLLVMRRLDTTRSASPTAASDEVRCVLGLSASPWLSTPSDDPFAVAHAVALLLSLLWTCHSAHHQRASSTTTAAPTSNATSTAGRTTETQQELAGGAAADSTSDGTEVRDADITSAGAQFETAHSSDPLRRGGPSRFVRLGVLLRIGSSAYLGALVLVVWPMLTPCAPALALFCVGAGALLASPRWSAAAAAAAAAAVSQERAGTAASAASVRGAAKLAVHASGALALRGRCRVPARVWMGGSLATALLWTLGLYVLNCVQCFASMKWLFGGAARRAGLACCPPLPHVNADADADAPAAFGIQLVLAAALAACCHAHSAALAEASCRLDEAERADTAGAGVAEPRPTMTCSRSWSTDVLVSAGRAGGCASSLPMELRLWIAPRSVLLLSLLVGVLERTIIRAVLTLLALSLLCVRPSTARRHFYVLVCYSAAYALAQAAAIAVAPAAADLSGSANATEVWRDLVGLRTTDTDADVEVGLRALGWPLLLLSVHSLLAVLFNSHEYRRLAARRHWAAVRRAVLQPRLRVWHSLGSDAAEQVAPWLNNFVLLVAALMPPVSLFGFTCLAVLVLRLSVQLSVASAAVRARRMGWLWLFFGSAMLVALLVRYVLRIPHVAQQLQQLTDDIEDNCQSRLSAISSATTNSTSTCVDEFLQDVGLGGGFPGYNHLAAELFINALLVALAAVGYRVCFAFHTTATAAAAAEGAKAASHAAAIAEATVATAARLQGKQALKEPHMLRRILGHNHGTRSLTRRNVAAAGRSAWYATRYNGASGTVRAGPMRLSLLPTAMLTVMLPLSTMAVFCGCLGFGLLSHHAMGLLYLTIAVLCSFGRGRRLVWLPTSLLSALTLLCHYAFQLRFGGSRVEVTGCRTNDPSAGCDLEWAGFDQIATSHWQDRSVQLLLRLLPGILLLTLCVLQRQLQLHRHAVITLPLAKLVSHFTAGGHGAARSLPPSSRLLTASRRLNRGLSALAAAPFSAVDRRGSKPPASLSPGADIRVLAESVRAGAEAKDSGRVADAAETAAAEAAVHVNRAAWRASVRRLQRGCAALMTPIALFTLVVAATQRLNVWGVFYMLAVGWLRFAGCGEPDSRLSRASWLVTRILLVLAVLLQYIAALTLPPTVLPHPDRRPWSTMGDGWMDATSVRLNATCARLGSMPADEASGLVCWLALDGGLPARTLWVDLCALAMCTLRDVIRRTAPLADAAAAAGPRLAWAERWILRSSHVVTLLLIFLLSSAASLQESSGLLAMGYLIISLYTLAFARRNSVDEEAGRPWRHIHRYAWLVLAVLVAFQAPLVSDSCGVALGEEWQGAPWCALWMATLGVFQLHTAESDEDAIGDYRAASWMLPFVFIWLIVDVQRGLLFANPRYAIDVLQWHKMLRANRHKVRAVSRWRAEQERELVVRRLHGWRFLRARKLQRIGMKLELIVGMLQEESPYASVLDQVAGGGDGLPASPRIVQQLPDARGGAKSNVQVAADELSQLGFDEAQCKTALLQSGSKFMAYPYNPQDWLGAQQLLQALTLLLQAELGLGPPLIAGDAAAETAEEEALRGSNGDASQESGEGGAAMREATNNTTSVDEKAGTMAAVRSALRGVGGWLLQALCGVLKDLRDPVLFQQVPLAYGRPPPSGAAAPAPEPPCMGAMTSGTMQSGCDDFCRGLDEALHVAAGTMGEQAESMRAAAMRTLPPLLQTDISQPQRTATPPAMEPTTNNTAAVTEDTSLLQLMLQALLSRTLELVWLALIINHCVNGSILSLVFPLSCFLYGMLEDPRPSRLFFSVLLFYTMLLMALKMLYQLPLVCGSPPLSFRSSVPNGGGVVAVCNEAPTSISAAFLVELPLRSDHKLGLHKFTGTSSLPRDHGLLRGLLPDLSLFLLLLLHREMLYWRGGTQLDAGMTSQSDPSSCRSARSARATPTKGDEKAPAKLGRFGLVRLLTRRFSPPPPAIQVLSVSCEGDGDDDRGEQTLAAAAQTIDPGEVTTTSQDVSEAHVIAVLGGSSADVVGSTRDSSTEEIVLTSERNRAGDTVALVGTQPSPPPPSRLWRLLAATRAASTVAAASARVASTRTRRSCRGFWKRLMPLDRDAKGGVDLHMASFSVCLLVALYTLTFSDEFSTSSDDIQDQLTSQFSGATVFTIFLAVSVMIADRIIYRAWEPPTEVRTASASMLISHRASTDSAPAAAAADASEPRSLSPAATDAAHGRVSLSYPCLGLQATAVQPPRLSMSQPPLLSLSASSPPDDHDEASVGSSVWEAGAAADAVLEREGTAGTAWATTGLSRAPLLKLTMHAALVVGLHGSYNFGMPLWTCEEVGCDGQAAEGCCTRGSVLPLFYLLCCCYLLLSATQLQCGLPLVMRDHPLTDSNSKLRMLVFKGFLLVPFLWELKAILDWTVERSSLDLFSYVKLEDIYAGLCVMRHEMNYRRLFPRGRERAAGWKMDTCFMGVLSVTGLMVVLLGPLLLFSSASPILGDNEVTSAAAHLSLSLALAEADGTLATSAAFELGVISSYELAELDADAPLLQTAWNYWDCLTHGHTSPEAASKCGYRYLVGSRSATYQRLRLRRSCDSTWGTNPQSLAAMRDALADNASSASLELRLTFERRLSLGATMLTHGVELDAAQRALMLAAAAASDFGAAADDAYNESVVKVSVTGLYPKFGRLGSITTDADGVGLYNEVDMWHTLQNLTVVAHALPSGLRWWSVEQSERDASPFDTTVDDGVQLVVAADRLAGGNVASSLTSGGVLAFYLVVVIGIGRLVRSAFGGTRYRLAVDEMPDTRDLIDLCEGVYIARREGQLLRETELQETIVRLFRSSESLTRLTGYQLVRNPRRGQ